MTVGMSRDAVGLGNEKLAVVRAARVPTGFGA